VLRVSDEEVFGQLDEVVARIRDAAQAAVRK
jgi:hypothetical protein